MGKRVIALDIETFYSDEYSLAGQKGLTMEHYIRNPEFEMQLLCLIDVKTGEQDHWDPQEHTQEQLVEMLDPENTIVVMHNMFFDAFALAFHYDIHFAEYIDTSALARWGLGDMHNGRAYWTLKAVSEYFGLKEKDRSALEAVKGKHREEIEGEQWDKFLEYCHDDALITAQAYTKFMEGPCKRMRPEALKVMSWTCHNWCNPRLHLDRKVLSDYAESVKDGRKKITKILGTTAKVLRSAPKFKALLESYGIEVGMKTSPTTKKEIPAFAKDDGWMKSAVHEPGMYGLLCRARLAMASNIGVTRADRLVGMSNRGHATVALQFCGATNTGRFSGCLTGDHCVTVLRNNQITPSILIEVRNSDLVWDGKEFVAHEGVKYSGRQEVISYQEITGTRCHPVLTRETGGYFSLEDAAESGYHIEIGGVPGAEHVKAALYGANNVEDKGICGVLSVWGKQALQGIGLIQGGAGVVPEVCLDGAYEGGGGSNTRHRSSHGGRQGTIHTGSSRHDGRGIRGPSGVGTVGETEVHKQESRTVQRLRRAWNRVQIQLAITGHRMGVGKFGCQAERPHDRQEEQRWSLRAWKSAVLNSLRAKPKSKEVCAQKNYRAVYDIVNCGPRHRFVANGKIVHNSDKVNWQNPPKELGDEPHPIRRSIVAPPGKILVSCDLSQIEARINAALAGQEDLLDVFRAGGDPYCFFGTDLFGRTITKADGPERFFSKMCILGLGYRMGWNRFFNECLHKYGMKDMTEMRAKETVNFYRKRYPAISGNWDKFDQIPVMMSRGQEFALGEGVQVNYFGGSSNELVVPTGFAMKYPKIRQVVNEDTGYNDWVYGAGKGYKMHGGITVENSCQCISGQVMEGQMATVIEAGVDIAMQVHDEVVVICDEAIAHDMGKWLVSVMSRSPDWWPELPLAAEYAVGKTFAEAK